MKVTNVEESSKELKPKDYNSWIHFWQEKTGYEALICSACDCWGRDIEGAHVQDALGFDKSVYIVPLCKACNHRTDEFEVPDDLMLKIPKGLPVILKKE